ncbi:MAG: pantoate--beta-alanine ligase [Planctomycetota bacterium]
MKVVTACSEFALSCDRFRSAGLTLGFVPTMGALHEGHLSLIRKARAECDRVAVSIYVNPTQFGPAEDFASYPVTTEADLDACLREGVDLVFLGRTSDMYPEGFQTWVSVEELSKPLCGRDRPHHFRGVATVVTQLLCMARPHRAYFGLKDYQQALVVRRLVEDLHLGVEIRTSETIREPDGLAMSSRNRRLGPEARATAPRICRALEAVRAMALEGETRVGELRRALRERLEAGGGIDVIYAEVLDARSLEELPGGSLENANGGAVVAVAARVGGVRLIDNVVIGPEEILEAAHRARGGGR